MCLKRIILCLLMLGVSGVAVAQKAVKPAAKEGLLYFSLAAQKNGKTITIVKENGRTISKDSLRMAESIAATYKLGAKTMTVKDIAYDSYFLSRDKEPIILQDMHGLTFDASIWMSCIDSLAKKEQVVFQVREIILEDGTKIQNPKLAKESKAVYKVETNPNFPPGGWESKSSHWKELWKEWFRIKDNNYFKLDEQVLELYASGIVFTVK